MSTYTIQPNDTLSAIAASFGLSLEALEAANPQISNPDEIEVGQVINIPSGGSSSGSTTPAIDDALAVQNAARAEAQNHGNHVPRGDLSWDFDLANAAQNWANHLANVDRLDHDPDAGAGENLFGGGGFSLSFADAAQGWVAEEADYHGEVIGEGDFEAWGHYTQCVWPSTSSVGMGSAVSASGTTYVVGRYLPGGNVSGEGAW